MKCKGCGNDYSESTSGFYAIMDNELIKCPNCIQKEIDALGDKGGVIKV